MTYPIAGAYSAATVHEAYGRRGALPSDLRPIDPRRPLAGRAMTVACAAGDNLWIHRALARASKGDVLVCTVEGGYEHGYWGEILTVAAMTRGVSGLVIDGGVRDADRIEALGFPVFCRRLCIRGTSKRHDAIGDIGCPLAFGDCVVETGDLIVGDRDGIVSVRASDTQSVLQGADARKKKEVEVLRRLSVGETTLAIYGWD